MPGAKRTELSYEATRFFIRIRKKRAASLRVNTEEQPTELPVPSCLDVSADHFGSAADGLRIISSPGAMEVEPHRLNGVAGGHVRTLVRRRFQII